MLSKTTAIPPKRHDSLIRRPKTKIHHDAPPMPLPNASLPNLTRSNAPDDSQQACRDDFSLIASPTSTGDPYLWIGNAQKFQPKLLPSLSSPSPSSRLLSASNPFETRRLTVLPTRSSSLANPVTTRPPRKALPPLPPLSSSAISAINENSKDDQHQSLLNKVDADVETSLLGWKRESTLTLAKPTLPIFKTPNFENGVNNVDLRYCSFFSENKDLWSSSSIFGNIEDILKKPTIQEECQHTADRLWAKDETLIPVKEIASYLGKSQLFNHTVLQLYLERYDFYSLTLESAFRYFCSTLYFKAEAQEIDRILEAFSNRYYYCNQDSRLLNSADVVYAVVYSVLLLNTDLHISQGSHYRMSRTQFCDNTMATIMTNINVEQTQQLATDDITEWKQAMQNYLKDLYTSVKLKGILQPSQSNESSEQSRSGVASLLQRMGSLKHSTSQRRKTNGNEQANDGRKSAKSQDSHSVDDHHQAVLSQEQQQHQDQHFHRVLELEGHFRYRTNDETRRRCTNRGWQDIWMSLYQNGYLQLEKQQTRHRHQIWNTDASSSASSSSWTLNLRHSIITSHATRHASDPQEMNTFHVLFSDNLWYEFECDDRQMMQQWVKRTQYWAAIVTRVPFMKSPVSSNLYGWETSLLNQFYELSNCTLSVWKSPPPQSISSLSSSSASSQAPSLQTSPTLSTMTPRMSSSSSSSADSSPSSTLSSITATATTSASISSLSIHSVQHIKDQQASIQSHLEALQEEHKHHKAVFLPINNIPATYHTQQALILTNWHEKNDYLIQEIERYFQYSESLQAAIDDHNSIKQVDPSSLLPLSIDIDDGFSFDFCNDVTYSFKL